MQTTDTTKRTLLYQEIGDELNLGMLSKIELIQVLWGGYGELVRVSFPHKNIIIKHILLPKALTASTWMEHKHLTPT